jgi:hypothetical protein
MRCSNKYGIEKNETFTTYSCGDHDRPVSFNYADDHPSILGLKLVQSSNETIISFTETDPDSKKVRKLDNAWSSPCGIEEL